MQPAYPPPKVTSDSKVACFHDFCTNPAKTGCPFCFHCCRRSGGDRKPICESHFSPEAIAQREAMLKLNRGARGNRRRAGKARLMQQTQQLEEAVDPQAASEAASSSTSTGPRPPKNPPPQHLLVSQEQKRALRTPSRSPPWRRRRN